MIYRLPSIVLRSLLGVLLLASLGGCSLSRKVFHPYRLPTPKPSPEYIAQQKEKKAAEKLRADKDKEVSALAKKKKSSSDTEEAATDVSMPTDNGAAASTNTSDIKSSVYPERSTVKYDKHELMKKPKLMRRRRHKYSKGFHPIESVRNFFKYGFHAKPNYSIDHKPVKKEPSEDALPDEPIPTPAPDVEPTEAEPKEVRKPKKAAPKSKQARKPAEPEPEPAPEPKPKRDKKAPKPDKAPRQEVVPVPDAEPVPDEPKPKRDKKQPKQKAPKPDKAPRQEEYTPVPDNKP